MKCRCWRRRLLTHDGFIIIHDIYRCIWLSTTSSSLLRVSADEHIFRCTWKCSSRTKFSRVHKKTSSSTRWCPAMIVIYIVISCYIPLINPRYVRQKSANFIPSTPDVAVGDQFYLMLVRPMGMRGWGDGDGSKIWARNDWSSSWSWPWFAWWYDERYLWGFWNILNG